MLYNIHIATEQGFDTRNPLIQKSGFPKCIIMLGFCKSGHICTPVPEANNSFLMPETVLTTNYITFQSLYYGICHWCYSWVWSIAIYNTYQKQDKGNSVWTIQFIREAIFSHQQIDREYSNNKLILQYLKTRCCKYYTLHIIMYKYCILCGRIKAKRVLYLS